MDKYAALEQAVSDSSLAIITDDISTQKELNTVFFRYNALLKKQKPVPDHPCSTGF